MRASVPYLVSLVLGSLSGALAQNDNPVDDVLSQVVDVVPGVISAVPGVASALTDEATSAEASSSSPSTSDESSSTSASAAATSSSTSALPSSAKPSAASSTPSEPASSTTQDIAAATSSTESGAQDGKNRTLAIALGVSLGLLALGILLGLLFCCWRRRRRQRRSKLAQKSPRSLSPEAFDAGKWRKGPIVHSGAFGRAPPGQSPTTGRGHSPHGPGTLPMTENGINANGAHHGLSGSGAPSSHRGHEATPSFRSGISGHNTAAHQPHSHSHTAAAGLGGAALGGLAAKHHHDKHEEANRSHGDSNNPKGILRKPVGGAHSANANEHPHSQHSEMGTSSRGLGSGAGTNSGSSIPTTGPPPYNNGTNGVDNFSSSHPPFGETHRHSAGHEPMMAGAAGTAAGAAVGAASAGSHHDRHSSSDSHTNDRHSWSANGQHHHPPSILANVAGRRHAGSTNPYVPARNTNKPRFDNNAGLAEMPAHREQGKHHDGNQSGPSPAVAQNERPRLMNRSPDRRFSSGGSPVHMPGSWRGSCDWGQNNRRGSFNGDSVAAESQPRSASFGDLRQQDEGTWYRGRKRSGTAGSRGFPSRPRYDSRFYAGRGVGQVT